MDAGIRPDLRGALDFETVPRLWRDSGQWLAAVPAGTAVTLDLAGVEQVDSAGLALLIAWKAQAQSAGVGLQYTSIPPRLLAIARISDAEALLQEP
jgi:phospholipid transport system transporter-binding protein